MKVRHVRCRAVDREKVESIAQAVDVYLDNDGVLYFVPKAAEDKIESDINIQYNKDKDKDKDISSLLEEGASFLKRLKEQQEK